MKDTRLCWEIESMWTAVMETNSQKNRKWSFDGERVHCNYYCSL